MAKAILQRIIYDWDEANASAETQTASSELSSL